MKSPLARVGVTMLAGIGWLVGVPAPLTAQVPSTPETESDNESLDNLPDDPNQMRSWACSQGDKKIEVEAQDESVWTETIKGSEWECSQQVSNLGSGALQFTCEPEEGTVGILTVTWLSGSGGQEQMEAWMKELEARPALGCQMGQVQPWDAE